MPRNFDLLILVVLYTVELGVGVLSIGNWRNFPGSYTISSLGVGFLTTSDDLIFPGSYTISSLGVGVLTTSDDLIFPGSYTISSLGVGVLTTSDDLNFPTVLLRSVTTCIAPFVREIVALDNATVGAMFTVNEVLFITDVIIVLVANVPVPLVTTGVNPTDRLSTVPLAVVIVLPLLEPVTVLVYVFHCREFEPAPGAGNIVAGMYVFI